uniref:Putative RNA-directed DNA polymerase from transposon X-element n=1 Tax=Anoplophora glabripennis TaxID=217634 RepID=V5GNF3_ANOGL
MDPPTSVQSLRIASWNVDGFRGRKIELKELLPRLDVDVMAIQETKVEDAHTVRIPGYLVYRRDRNRHGGGVALLVKRGIDHHMLQVPQLENMEAAAVSIRTRRYGDIAVVTCYQPPQLPLTDHDLRAVLETWPQTVAIGDFNAKSPEWHSTTTTTRGRVLLQFLQNHEDVAAYGPDGPTYYGAVGRPDVLDIALLRAIPMDADLTTHYEGATNHAPILLTLGDERRGEDTVAKRRTDWGLFRAEMQRICAPIPVIRDAADLEAAIASLETDIHTALEASTTETTERRIANYAGELPLMLQDLIRERRAAKRRATRTAHPRDKQTLNQLNRRVKAALEEHYQDSWQRHLESLNPEDRSLWTMQRALRTTRKPMPPIHGENGIVYTRYEKAEAFADSLELQCRENLLDDEDEDHADEVERRVRRYRRQPDRDDIRPATPEEVRDILRRLNPRKAPGCDQIGNRILRKLPHKGVMALLNIVNAILRLRRFPARWKKADVIFPKPGKNLTFAASYRPISLLPMMSKVAERIILTRLRESSDELRVIPDEQFAYRSGHSTEQQILRLVEHLSAGFNNRESTAAVFLDVAKAFDRVWHDGLLAKMLDFGYPVGLVKLVESFLRGRKLRAKVEGALSTYRDVEAGVPQGAVLSPHLFNIYTSDMPRTERTTVCLYADDTAITARSLNPDMAKRYLQRAVSQLEDWCNRWKVAINPEKSTGIMFSRRYQTRPQGHVKFNGEDIQWATTVKYLGVTLDRTLTWKPHVEAVTRKAKMVRAKLYPLLCRDSRLCLRNKLTLIRAVLQPQLTYAGTAWGHAAKTHLARVQAVENIALRCATGAPWFVRNSDIRRDLGFTSALEAIRERARKLFERAEIHSNPLIRNAVDYRPEEAAGRRRRPRHQLLDAG